MKNYQPSTIIKLWGNLKVNSGIDDQNIWHKIFEVTNYIMYIRNYLDQALTIRVIITIYSTVIK